MTAGLDKKLEIWRRRREYGAYCVATLEDVEELVCALQENRDEASTARNEGKSPAACNR